MAYKKQQVKAKLIKKADQYFKYTQARRDTIRISNDLRGFGGVEDGCIDFVAFEIVESLTEYRLIYGKGFAKKRKSIILHSWQQSGSAVKADIDLIINKGFKDAVKHKVRVWPVKGEIWFNCIRWVAKTPSNPLGKHTIHASKAMVLLGQKKDKETGFEVPSYQVFYPAPAKRR